MAHAVTQLGLVGAEIGTDAGSAELDDDGLEPFWEAAAGLRCLVLIHPNAAARTRLPYLLSNFVVNPADTIRMMIDLVGQDRVVLGSDYPFEMGDLDPLATVAKVPGLDDRGRRLIARGNAERLLAGGL